MKYARLVPIIVLSWVTSSVAIGAPNDQVNGPSGARAERKTLILKVGSAHVDITPHRTLPNYYATPIEPGDGSSSLRAHVVICSDGRTKAAIISTDFTFVGRDLVLRIRDELRRRIDIDADAVCIAATHTHVAPATAASFLNGSLPDPLYLDFVIERIGCAAEEANSRLKPARLAAETLPAPPIGMCRRLVSPEGQVYMRGASPDPNYPPENPIDEQMQYVVFETPQGKPLAVIFNVACHNNKAQRFYSGDMFGSAADVLREELGEDIGAAALAAPCGDVGHVKSARGRSFRNEQAAGRAIAEAILASYRHAERRHATKLVVQSVVKRIPDRPYDPAEFVYDGGRGSSEGAADFHRKRYTPEEAAVRQRGQTYCNVEMQVIAFGPVALVTNPAELFSIYSLKIKEASPFEVTMVSTLTNGYCGYVPTEKAFQHRGYETYRTVYTSRLAKDAGERILRDSVNLLRQARKLYEEMEPRQ